MVEIKLSNRDYAVIAGAAALCTAAITLLTLALDLDNLIALSGATLKLNIRNDIMIPVLLGLPNFAIVFWKIRQLAQARRKLETLASTDSLTGLLNRRAVQNAFEAVNTKGKHGHYALMVIDLDHFKYVNDTFGHDMGDRALKSVSDCIGMNLRDGEVLGRIGGEEFVIFIEDVTLANAAMIAERIRAAVENNPFSMKNLGRPLTASIGLAVVSGNWSFIELYKEADTCLYQAKNSGRNRVVVTSSTNPHETPLKTIDTGNLIQFRPSPA